MAMANDVVLGALKSRFQRQLVGIGGVRRIEAPLEESNPLEGGGGIIRRILSFGGWLISGIKSLFRFSATGVWGAVVQTTAFLWHFNWNASDEQLDAQLRGLQNQIASQFGATLGNLAGYYVCGILPASKMLRFNESMGMRILEEVSEEAFDEFAGNLSVLCQTMFFLSAQAAITTAFKNTRRVIKSIFENPNSPQSMALNSIFGGRLSNAVQAWGETNQAWTFAEKVEERIDNISNEPLRFFTEDFLEEFFDACVEAGYIVANGIDAWYAQQRLQRDIILGAEEGVEIKPNRESDERIIIAGRDQLIRPVITQTMATAQFVENRDIGQFMGEPVREYVKSAPTKLSVRLVWSRFEVPPMYRDGVYRPPSIEIKGFKRTQLEFNLIKQLMGGLNGRNWGRFFASASLVDPSGAIVSRPRIYAGSEAEAKDLLYQLFTQLSDFEIGTMNTGEEQRIGRKANNRALAKETLKVYPAYMTIFHAQKVINEDEGRTQLAGTYKRKDQRLPLWVSTKPKNWEETINELLLASGADSPTP